MSPVFRHSWHRGFENMSGCLRKIARRLDFLPSSVSRRGRGSAPSVSSAPRRATAGATPGTAREARVDFAVIVVFMNGLLSVLPAAPVCGKRESAMRDYFFDSGVLVDV